MQEQNSQPVWPPYIVDNDLDVTADVFYKSLSGLSHKDRTLIVSVVIKEFSLNFSEVETVLAPASINPAITSDSYLKYTAVAVTYICLFLSVCAVLSLSKIMFLLASQTVSIPVVLFFGIAAVAMCHVINKASELCQYKDIKIYRLRTLGLWRG